MEKKYKQTFRISGRTERGSVCSMPYYSNKEVAIAYFIHKFPRFRGNGEIMTQMVQDYGDGFVMADASNWQPVCTFKSTKELKGLIKGAC